MKTVTTNLSYPNVSIEILVGEYMIFSVCGKVYGAVCIGNKNDDAVRWEIEKKLEEGQSMYNQRVIEQEKQERGYVRAQLILDSIGR